MDKFQLVHAKIRRENPSLQHAAVEERRYFCWAQIGDLGRHVRSFVLITCASDPRPLIAAIRFAKGANGVAMENAYTGDTEKPLLQPTPLLDPAE